MTDAFVGTRDCTCAVVFSAMDEPLDKLDAAGHGMFHDSPLVVSSNFNIDSNDFAVVLAKLRKHGNEENQ